MRNREKIKLGIVGIDDVLRNVGGRADWHFTSFYIWLKQAGFFCKGGVFYRVVDNIASVVGIKDISDYVENNLFYDRTPTGRLRYIYRDHLEMFNKNRSRYINEKNFLLVLGEYNGRELRDTRDYAFFPFLNGIVCVNRDGVRLCSYKDILKNGLIVFEDKIIKREIRLVSRDTAIYSDFGRFCKLAIDGDSGRNKNGVVFLRRAMGYMLHNYKDPANAMMVFFTDVNNSEGISEGRSGKSLCSQVALRQLRNLAVIDGKQFDSKDKFMLETVDKNTEIVCMQDIRNDFRQETLNNMITGDFQIGRKYLRKEVIPFKYAPKIIADSNFALRLVGGSDFARVCVIGFSHYFNYKNTPGLIFKKRFFDEWDSKEWDKFYTYMFYCVVEYMKHGAQSYKLDDVLNYSIYNKYPVELCVEIKEILKSDDNFFMHPMESKYYWERIGYFNSVGDDIGNYSKLKMVTDIMREYGWKKYAKVQTIRGISEGKKDSSKVLHWFEKVIV